ncbi:MAG: TolC family protein, partial [Ghiorsea sp.]|nr:TolC family protein [Ghiorsea sp.]
MKSFPVYVLPLLAVWSWAGIAHAETAPLTLAQAKALVVQSPLLQAQKSRAKALAFKPVQAGSLPDPVLSLGAISFPVDTWKRGQENMTQFQVGISQTLPFPGKLGLLEDAARFTAKAGQEDVAELRLQLLSQVQVRWWNLYYLDKALDIVEKNQSLLRQFIKIAETKYKTGKGLQQDVLLAQLELSKLLDSQMQWQSLRQSEQARLNALLNQPATQHIVLPDTVNERLQDLR